MKKILAVFVFLVLLVGCSLANTPTSKVEELLTKYQTLDKDIKTGIDEVIDEEVLTSKQKDRYRSLIEKQYISIEMNKSNGIIEEYISLDLFFKKINACLIENDTNDNSSDIYSKFEKEFGRTLSPVEYETISKWIENNIPLNLIEAALKEAILNGVNSIRYIDKILFEWNKKGYKDSTDIIRKNNKEEYIEEIYDYDWLNE